MQVEEATLFCCQWPFQQWLLFQRPNTGPSTMSWTPGDASYSTCNYSSCHCPEARSSQYFYNSGQYVSGHGTMNIKNITKFSSSNPLEDLQKYCSSSAAFDSAARPFNPPRCTESTRLQVRQRIEEWTKSEGNSAVPSSMFLLYGGAGVGKSAIAQSISENLQKSRLAASFFFCRNDTSRNNGDHFFPTLISQLADTFKDLRRHIETKIRESPALLTKRAEIQIRELFIEPLRLLQLSNASHDTRPLLIVIDGLNECQVPGLHPECELLRLIAKLVLQSPYPLRFLITSRPEAHIMGVFDRDPDLQAITVHRWNLSDDPDADVDIRKFLEEEFAKIRRIHRIGWCLPAAWPDQKAITSLVERSSRHFIYASTVIRYIQSDDHRPDDRLEVILRPRPPQEGDRPLAELDALYGVIFADVKDKSQRDKICLTLGIVHIQSRNFECVPGCTVEDLLQMKPGDLQLVLGPISSLVGIEGDKVRILHKSLFAYLLDRSSELNFDLMRAHGVAATYLLQHRIANHAADLDDFRRFVWHCRFSYLTDTSGLKDYLQSLKVPFPNSVMTALTNQNFPSRGMTSVSIIWHIFRILTRKDLYFTTHFYQQYLKKWIDYLRPTVPTVTRTEDELKCELDQLLAEWQPASLNQMDVGMDPIKKILDRREEFIKQEHSVFSSYGESSISDNTGSFTSVSSLVSSDDFIHSYNLWMGDEESFLFLRTYSRHHNRYFAYGFAAYSPSKVIERAKGYLEKAEKCLASELYQKYGVMPEEVHWQDEVTKKFTVATENDPRSLNHPSRSFQ